MEIRKMPHEQPRDKETWSLCVNILRDKQVKKKASFREVFKEINLPATLVIGISRIVD